MTDDEVLHHAHESWSQKEEKLYSDELARRNACRVTPRHVFALDLSGLRVPEVTVWTAWHEGDVASVGASKMLPDGTAEVKSMRTHPKFVSMGAGSAILDTIITAAMTRGVRRLSLETGSGPAFENALALYRRRGFELGAAFGGYEPSDFNQFLHMDLKDS